MTPVLDLASYELNLFALPPLVVGALSMTLGAASLIREGGSPRSWSLFGLCLTVWLWLASFSLMYLAVHPDVALGWARVGYVGICLIAPATYDFATRLLEIRPRRRWVVRWSWIVFTGFLVVFVGTDRLLASLHRYPWGFYPSLEPEAATFVVLFMALIGLALWELLRRYRHAESETERLRAHAFLVGFSTGALALLDYLPSFGVEVYPVGFLPVMVYLAIVALAIWRYRLTDLTPGRIADRLVRTMPDMLIACDMKKRIRMVNPALSRTLRHMGDKLEGRPLRTLIADENGRGVIDELFASPVAFDREVKLKASDGSVVDVSVSASEVRDDHDRRVGTVLIAHDVREEKRMQRRLLRRALFDHLTGLPGRDLLLTRAARALEESWRGEVKFALICLQVERLDSIGDSLGLEASDAVLRRVAKRIGDCALPSDTVARLEGNEFAILRCPSDHADALQVVGEIRHALTAPFDVHGQDVFLGVSFGIAMSDGDYREGAEPLRDARTALHCVTEANRSRVEVFDDELRSRATRRLVLESELRRGVVEGQLEVWYQPIVSLDDGRVRACEALLRWSHPRWGTVRPAQFLKAAENAGLMMVIGNVMLRRACSQSKEWDEQWAVEGPALRLHVNLSAQEIADARTPHTMETVLHEAGLDAGRVVVELTETTLMEPTTRILENMRALCSMGVRFALDDFGTGYSSLSHLRRFPVDMLKIDRSFVSGEGGRGDLEITRAILNLGRSLGLEVIAEGIETADQLELLRDLECRYGQGYYLAAPARAVEIVPSLYGRVAGAVGSTGGVTA